MNTKLLRRVAKHIAEEPKRLNMGMIAKTVDQENKNSPKCGTVGCIAGWACLLSGMDVNQASWSRAEELLDLDGDESFRLFDFPSGSSGDGWPHDLSKRYRKCTTRRGKANTAVARIERFIATKGEE